MKKAGLPDRTLKSMKSYSIIIFLSVIVMIALISFVMDHGATLIKSSPVLFGLLSVGLILGYLALIGFFGRRHMRAVKEAAAKELAAAEFEDRPPVGGCLGVS